MTSRPPTQCLSCVHFRSPLTEGVPQPTWPLGTGSCDAYPDEVDAIPADIWWNRADHRERYEGDHGIGWEPLVRNGEPAKFPEYAMNT